MSAAFVANEEQHKAATASKARVEKQLGRTVKTPILPVGTFTIAEDYHQKYYLRQSPFIGEFEAIYPDPAAFTASTAAARVNGYLAGDGDPEQVKAEIDKLGLSESARIQLLRAAGVR